MQVQPLKDGMYRVFFNLEEFLILLRSTKSRRGRLAMMLMALSLRVGTVAQITLDQFFQDDEGYWWLHVEAKDATERDEETKPRDVWIPKDIMKKVKQYAKEKGRTDDDELFDVEKRTLQRDVETARENAAIKSGDEDFLKVSAHDFRRYYVTNFLFERDVDIQTVRQIGGWKRVEHMLDYMLLTRDLVRNRLAEADLLGQNPFEQRGDSEARVIDEKFDSLEEMLAQSTKPKSSKRIKQRLYALVDKLEDVTIAVDNSAASRSQSADSEALVEEQRTIRGFTEDFSESYPDTEERDHDKDELRLNFGPFGIGIQWINALITKLGSRHQMSFYEKASSLTPLDSKRKRGVIMIGVIVGILISVFQALQGGWLTLVSYTVISLLLMAFYEDLLAIEKNSTGAI